jgi:RNA polymerase sigma-70 factor (ECF subfamily)
MRHAPSPVVALNGAVAVAMASGPEAGLRLIDDLADAGELTDYPYLHAAQADLLRRLGRWDEAAEAYRRAEGLTSNAAERAFLARRIREMAGAAGGRAH